MFLLWAPTDNRFLDNCTFPEKIAFSLSVPFDDLFYSLLISHENDLHKIVVLITTYLTPFTACRYAAFLDNKGADKAPARQCGQIHFHLRGGMQPKKLHVRGARCRKN